MHGRGIFDDAILNVYIDIANSSLTNVVLMYQTLMVINYSHRSRYEVGKKNVKVKLDFNVDSRFHRILISNRSRPIMMIIMIMKMKMNLKMNLHLRSY